MKNFWLESKVLQISSIASNWSGITQNNYALSINTTFGNTFVFWRENDLIQSYKIDNVELNDSLLEDREWDFVRDFAEIFFNM